jgi:hypothetical protein
MKKTTTHIVLFVILPVFAGGLIYLLTRPDSLIMFEWFNKIGILENIKIIRSQINLKSFLNDWIIYNSPALIWSFSLTVLLGVIWENEINKRSLIFLITPSLLGIISEIFQKINLINGTFDYCDLLLYLIGGLTGILIIKSKNTNQKIKLSWQKN